MEREEIDKLTNKLVAVITSCVTLEQLSCATKYYELLFKKFSYSIWSGRSDHRQKFVAKNNFCIDTQMLLTIQKNNIDGVSAMITFAASVVLPASERNGWSDTVVLTVDKIAEESFQLTVEVEKLSKNDLIEALTQAVDLLEGNFT